MKTIAFGCDHGGFDLKATVINHLQAAGYTVIDCGCDSNASVDYPVYADKVCNAITEGKADLGILICGTGLGMSIAANKHAGIRASACENTFSARMTREHNDTNVLCLGARVIGAGLCLDMVDLFVTTEFIGAHHQKRVDMLKALDK